MSTMEAVNTFCKPLSANGILSELAQARESYENGEGEDFDTVIDEISAKYGL